MHGSQSWLLFAVVLIEQALVLIHIVDKIKWRQFPKASWTASVPKLDVFVLVFRPSLIVG